MTCVWTQVGIVGAGPAGLPAYCLEKMSAPISTNFKTDELLIPDGRDQL